MEEFRRKRPAVFTGTGDVRVLLKRTPDFCSIRIYLSCKLSSCDIYVCCFFTVPIVMFSTSKSYLFLHFYVVSFSQRVMSLM